ncbi:MAG: hypothetical protein QNK37_04310 [Acidobacteriota bacterium]|nr:hypothetical protein [Acidobacteriota bacterium]
MNGRLFNSALGIIALFLFAELGFVGRTLYAAKPFVCDYVSRTTPGITEGTGATCSQAQGNLYMKLSSAAGDMCPRTYWGICNTNVVYTLACTYRPAYEDYRVCGYMTFSCLIDKDGPIDP